MNPQKIVCIGAGPQTYLLSKLQLDLEKDFVIALDGGLNWAIPNRIFPTIFLGDCDSLSSIHRRWLETSKIPKLIYPPEKDESDFELGSRYIVSHFSSSIPVVLVNMRGGRTDHFLTNLSIAKQLSIQGFYVEFVGDTETIVVSNGSRPIEIQNQSYTSVTLYPLTESVEGVTTEQLQYPLRGESLYQNTSRGLSNIPIGKKFTIIHMQGILAIILVNGGMNENICRHCQH